MSPVETPAWHDWAAHSANLPEPFALQASGQKSTTSAGKSSMPQTRAFGSLSKPIDEVGEQVLRV